MINHIDPLAIGSTYKYIEIHSIYTIKAKLNNIICVQNNNKEISLWQQDTFRLAFTAIHPIKTWPDTPNINKQYGIHFLGRTHYGYDWITEQFVAPDKKYFLHTDETIQEYFIGNGVKSKYQNTYEIKEFNTIEKLLEWLN